MSLYGDVDMAAVLYGRDARHVPAWLYVQHGPADVVSFIGASQVPGAADSHPLRYGSRRTHQLILGEIVVRPHAIIATDALRGYGLAGLIDHPETTDAMLAQGETLLTSPALDAWIRRGW